MDYNYRGAAEGFIPTKVLYNHKNDLNGLIGVLPSDNSIWIAFRGTESFQNWMVDFDSLQHQYATWPECDCKVHAGFDNAVNSIAYEFVAEIQRLRLQYPTYSVKATGHSLGAALAHLSALVLIKNDIPVLNMVNFGQPRIGNSAFAKFSS